MLASSIATIPDQHAAVGEAARLDDAMSSQVDTSVRHDATMTAIAQKVLIALDLFVSWENAPGADQLKKLMPEFRREVNFGLLDPTRCPYDDEKLESYIEVDENGSYRVFQCATTAHTFQVASGSHDELPDFEEFGE